MGLYKKGITQGEQLRKINLEQDYIDKGEITQGKQLGKINLKQDYIVKGKITQDKLDKVIEIDRNR